MTLGERIVYYRNQKGITQKSLADRMGISNTRLNYWEKDKREPDVKMINLLCEVLEIDPKELLSDKTEKPPTPAGPEQRAEAVSMEDVERVLVSLGYIQPGQDLTDADVKIVGSVLDILETWFQQ